MYFFRMKKVAHMDSNSILFLFKAELKSGFPLVYFDFCLDSLLLLPSVNAQQNFGADQTSKHGPPLGGRVSVDLWVNQSVEVS